MRKILTFILVLTATVAVARNVSQFFVMPEADAVVKLVDRNGRLDMVDYFLSGHNQATRNVFHGDAQITYADSLRMTMDLDRDVTLTLALAVDGRDTTIVAIHTVSSPEKESSVAFFDTNLQPRPAATFKAPVLNDWLTALGREEREQAQNTLPFLLTTAEYDPEDNVLMLTDNTATYFVPGEQRTAVARWIRPQLRYALKGKKFQLKK